MTRPGGILSSRRSTSFTSSLVSRMLSAARSITPVRCTRRRSQIPAVLLEAGELLDAPNPMRLARDRFGSTLMRGMASPTKMPLPPLWPYKISWLGPGCPDPCTLPQVWGFMSIGRWTLWWGGPSGNDTLKGSSGYASVRVLRLGRSELRIYRLFCAHPAPTTASMEPSWSGQENL